MSDPDLLAPLRALVERITAGVGEVVNCRKVKAHGCDCREGGLDALAAAAELAAALPALEAAITARPLACACAVPDPVMQADERFYCHRCSFQTGARPTDLSPEDCFKQRAAAEARVQALEQEHARLTESVEVQARTMLVKYREWATEMQALTAELAKIEQEMRDTLIKELCGPDSNELVRTQMVRLVIGEWADALRALREGEGPS